MNRILLAGLAGLVLSVSACNGCNPPVGEPGDGGGGSTASSQAGTGSTSASQAGSSQGAASSSASSSSAGTTSSTPASSSGAGSSSSIAATSASGTATSVAATSQMGTSSSGPVCVPTGTLESSCNGVDDDCDSMTDEDVDYGDPHHCGTCATNCFNSLVNVERSSVACTASGSPGVEPGTCHGTCAAGYADLDNDGTTCGTYCVQTASGDATCDGQDDDCDGMVDEDVDLCTSTDNCGACGRACNVLHGSPVCVHTGQGPCSAANTLCGVGACACTGPGDCWHDVDQNPANGCEYACTPSNGGVEVCDGVDNDCDGLGDEVDDLSADMLAGAPCSGGVMGECAAAAHLGTMKCVGNIYACVGPNVLTASARPETCNGLDDDCDGTADNAPQDIGARCGVSDVSPCVKGSTQCVGGVPTCVGNVDPAPEVCDGVDNDCDGTPDSTGGLDLPSVPCNVPVTAPTPAAQVCAAGHTACAGGQVTCLGAIGRSAAVDGCGVDSNCDGQLTNQPDLMSDVEHCRDCSTNCLQGAVHAAFACVTGSCVFQGCAPGFHDLDGDNTCEYACVFVSAQESCNGVDDDCDGTTDEDVQAPLPSQVCGTSPAATGPECTSAVGMACTNGAWKCTFPADVCSPNCAAAVDVCDTLDNNCNGVLNEAVPGYGRICYSDDGIPAPGHGLCRTQGTMGCNGTNALKCSALKADCNLLPGGCTELCDGMDNDCDGATDEGFLSKGANMANFVKPAVTKVSTAPDIWMFSVEASRPNASNAAPRSQGTGNGYTSPPAGTASDKTRACSVSGRLPWTRVTAAEANQACVSMGGTLCSQATWQAACQATASCSWGYNPRGAACTSTFAGTNTTAGTKYCNLGPSFDFDANAANGDADGLLVAGSTDLAGCWADWSGLNGNAGADTKLLDITGNVRELTAVSGNTVAVMGGSYVHEVETGAQCNAADYQFSDTDSAQDVGFRCCFTQDPTQ